MSTGFGTEPKSPGVSSATMEARRARNPLEASRWLRLHLQKSLQELTAQLKQRQRKLDGVRKRA